MDASWRRAITADDFFYVVEDNYDDYVELAIPFYQEMHAELVRVLRAKKNTQPWIVLDLGSGTGKTSAQILKHFNVSRLDAIDLFDVMHAHARERLASFIDKITFITGDFMNVEFNGSFDVCVSALAIHHQTAEGKRHVFEKIYSRLDADGIFVMIDWTKFTDSQINHLAFESAAENVSSKVRDKRTVSNWIEHWHTKNIPDTIEDQIRWLREAGFPAVECTLRYWGMTMICAKKGADGG